MKLPENVPRIKSPAFAVLRKRYLRPQRPVILTDLRDGRPIHRVRTMRQAGSVLGHVPVALKMKPRFAYEELLGPQPKSVLKELGIEPPGRHPRYCSLDAYLAMIRRDPGTTAKCVDQPTPSELWELAAFPDHYRLKDDGAADHVTSSMYVANRGAVTRLHFDPDYKHALLYQIFGLKRVILIPPAMSKLLMPYDNASLLTLQHMPDEERRRLLEFAGGYHCVIRPGEALYIPPAWYHFIEYETVGMSLNFRFGWNAYTEFMARRLHHNLFSQGIGAKFSALDGRTDRRAENAFRRLRAAADRPARSPLEKYDRIERLLEELYPEICPENLQGTWWFPLDRYFTMKYKQSAARFYYGRRTR